VTPYISRITELEDEGRYLEAYGEWYRTAVEDLIEAEFRPWKGGGSIAGSLLYATSCAVRGTLPTKAEFAAGTVDFLADHVERHPPSTEPRAFVAASVEWSGDAYLLLGDERAITRYREARKHFEHASEGAARRWGMEAGYEHGSDAIWRYLGTVDWGPPDMAEFGSWERERRLPAKLDLATQRLAREYGTDEDG
jgi:hypothetical protein